MVYVKWTFLAVIAALVASFLHYTLPQHDIVRITNTDVRRIDYGDNSIFWARSTPGMQEGSANRDVMFIESFTPDGDPNVYRNEDTGWGWPPYFKVNSSNLQALARDAVSTRDAPQWMVVTHYGWRNEYLSIYPNAVKLREVDSPEVTIIPWFNIVFLSVLALIALWIWRILARFKEDRIEPLIDEAGDFMESVDDRAEGIFKRIFGGKRR
ncbi:DUF1523 family protein [Rhodovulum adriaticum]|uniref:Uncharacterized protein DUF1523 n=1 Tax=Rhodovulum adriaticum TaxID=35804 RepID=A0A4R2NYF7_RHOAD|nr:DUF1523 family protein [Rhodovulum adriaticum]MBK1634310.1 hypothetical protein [Rhodovulum adriaticum]TCP27137.1 uncharacterized protein DUF1523 [Rhodovulum adriaticum]